MESFCRKDVDDKEIKTAMESVSAEDVKSWLSENIGETFLSKRKKAFSLKKIKQKNSAVKYFSENIKKVASF
jgi:hypothetical protein